MSLESYNNFFNKWADDGGTVPPRGTNEQKELEDTKLPGLGGEDWNTYVTNITETDIPQVTEGPSLPPSYNYRDNPSINDNSFKPKMTVDEVYGKANQSIVESQGDYKTSSNEKSNVETSTFGKQADISVTPASVTESKGIVNNSTIQSVEGLNFQQKDKASQDVLDSRKKRDEAEAEDKSNQMRDKIKSAVTNTDTKEDVNDFQLGDRNEDIANAKAKVDQLNNQLKEKDDEYEAARNEQASINEAVTQAQVEYIQAFGDPNDKSFDLNTQVWVMKPTLLESAKSKLAKYASKNGVDIGDISGLNAKDFLEVLKETQGKVDMHYSELAEAAGKRAIQARMDSKAITADRNKAKQEYDALISTETTPEAETTPTTTVETETTPATTPTEAPTETTQSVAETAIATAKDAINNSTNASEEEKAAATESLDAVNNSVTKVQEMASKLTESLDNVSDVDVDAYMTSLKELNKNYEDANDKVSFFKRTDFNKQYVTAIAKANDFDVTLADGSKMSFSEFSMKMATKSPRIAEAMYNAKADRLQEEGHPVLAKMERNKAKMVGNWLGSKFTFADDLVRNQFNQMAETNMRATYAAYNNVLNDPNATTEQKAEARSAIDQANSLMTASAALKASTGFWSGIGDGMGDGTYGTTDPETLNAYQKTLNTINNYTKVVLGLGVTPGANRAYQNMYYLAGDEVNKSLLFNKDFNSDGFALCQEYGNSATAGMIAGAGELSTGVALMFNPSTMGMGINLIVDSIRTIVGSLYGVAGDVNKSEDYTRAVLGFFEDAKDIAEKSISVDAGNEEAVSKITSAISQIENFRLGSEEANSFDNWLEGSGSNTADGGKFNQALTYEEWLKLIEADPTMQEYAKKLIAEKKNAKESNADTGVNS